MGVSILQLLTLATAATAVNIGRADQHKKPAPKPKQVWPGFSHLKYAFVFGDSYTTIGFDPNLAQPSPSNPLGNPPYPGYTSSNGPNWVDFLTTTWNASLLQTIDLAYGGATIDSNLVAPYINTVKSVSVQVNEQFVPYYGKKNGTIKWTSDNSLFAFFDGINDTGNSWWSGNATLYDTIFKEWAGLLDTIYKTGGRNFLFLNVPPVQRAPNSASGTDADRATFKGVIQDWNARVDKMQKNLTSTYSDVTSFLFDTYTLFDQVLDNPCSNALTAPYKNTTDYCAAYANGTPTWYSFNSTCGIPVDEYFWLNSLHPTFRMHNATAQAVAKQLKSAKPSC